MLECDIVDVFSSVITDGNPVAVIHHADDLEEGQMQKLASWIGLPETAFLLRPASPEHDYAVRIFAPSCELPFAGHPSIGALAAQLSRRAEWSDKMVFIQECKSGLVTLDVARLNGDELISVQTPQCAEVRALGEKEALAFGRALGTSRNAKSCEHVGTGAKWIVMGYEQACEVLDAKPDQQAILTLSIENDASGVTIFAPTQDGVADYVVRSFAPRIGVAEDAACGGGNACVAASLAHASRAQVRYTATQGQKLGRNAIIFASGPYEDQRFRLGGHTRIVMSGMLNPQ